LIGIDLAKYESPQLFSVAQLAEVNLAVLLQLPVRINTALVSPAAGGSPL
jgi:hypothetical protein